jgi:hypothetical protein
MFAEVRPASLLDVGCGLGVWAKAAMSFGISDVMALDGGEIDPQTLQVPRQHFPAVLTNSFHSGGSRCGPVPEVGEHLAPTDAGRLISNLVNQSDLIIFPLLPIRATVTYQLFQRPDYAKSIQRQGTSATTRFVEAVERYGGGVCLPQKFLWLATRSTQGASRGSDQSFIRSL